MALLPFENLTGDPQLDWMQSALPRIIGAQLSGVAGTLPMLAGTQRDATALAATRYVHGYFDRRGPKNDLHFEMLVEDAGQHRIAPAQSSGAGLLAVAEGAARNINPAARPFSTKNAEATAAWARGEFERAVQVDPDFGAAWLAWVQQVAASDRPKAAEVAARALSRNTLQSPLDRAQLEMTAATIRGDLPTRSTAIATIAKLVPNDAILLVSLATAELNSRRFQQAVPLFEQVLLVEPANRVGLNLLGYAFALSGQMDKAKQTFERYAQAVPEDRGNAFDSLGESYFLNGDFANAEKQFLAAHQAAPQALAGGDLAKAAYARWLSGDLRGADRIFDQYAEFRGKLPDPTLVWRQAQWHYATGRRAEAEQILKTASGPASALVRPQLDVWANPEAFLPKDIGQRKLAVDGATTSDDGLPRVLYAEALLKAGRRDEARDLLKHWPLPESTKDPLLQSLLFPRFLALRAQLQ